MSSDDIRDLCAQLADRVHVHAVIDDVGYLVRGGRAGLVEPPKHGRQRQMIAVQGHTVPLGQHRDRARAVRHLLDHLGEHARHGIDRWALAHGDADDVDDVVSRAGKVLRRASVQGVVADHAGSVEVERRAVKADVARIHVLCHACSATMHPWRRPLRKP